VDPEAFGQIEKGLVSLLRHLRMLPGTASPAERAIVIGLRSNVSSDFDGIFYWQVKAGEHVQACAALGYITDSSGNESAICARRSVAWSSASSARRRSARARRSP
jgi:predicted deacylase